MDSGSICAFAAALLSGEEKRAGILTIFVFVCGSVFSKSMLQRVPPKVSTKRRGFTRANHHERAAKRHEVRRRRKRILQSKKAVNVLSSYVAGMFPLVIVHVKAYHLGKFAINLLLPAAKLCCIRLRDGAR